MLSKQQLSIYQNNVRGALQKTLAQVYPVCRKILGENYFKQLASHYIHHYPSRHHDLNGYGEYFSSFIKAECQQRSELNDYPYLSDLVLLEWFRQQIYYAAEEAVFDFPAFAQLSEQQQAQTVFQLAPHVRFIHSDFPVVSIWQINQQALKQHQTLPSQSESCCIFRKNNHIEMTVIDTNIYSLLALIKEGATLEKIAQAGQATLLPELIHRGWVDGFRVSHV
jgi:hypothetical protein